MTGRGAEQNYHGRQLQRELRRLRIEAGYTLEEAGERAHIEFKKLSRLEIRQLPTYHELLMLLDVYGVLSCDWEPYLELWELAKKTGWWRQYTRFDNGYLRMEDEAVRKTEFQLGFLPTLLQTEDYAAAALAADFHPSRKVVTNLLTLRMRQQERLVAAQRPLKLHALVHLPTLHQGVDRAQLIHLAERAELPNVTIQVVPHTRGVHIGLRGSVVLLSFDDESESDTAFTDTYFGFSELEGPQQTVTVKRVLDRVVTVALTPGESLALIQKMIATKP